MRLATLDAICDGMHYNISNGETDAIANVPSPVPPVQQRDGREGREIRCRHSARKMHIGDHEISSAISALHSCRTLTTDSGGGFRGIRRARSANGCQREETKKKDMGLWDQ